MSVLQKIERAKRGLKVAEIMLINTYPMSKDPKIFLAVSEDIYFSVIECITGLMYLDKKEIPEQREDLIEEFEDLNGKFDIRQDDIDLAKSLHKIIKAHAESPVEFNKNEKFIICDENYGMKSFGIEDMKKYLFDARILIEKVSFALENSKI